MKRPKIEDFYGYIEYFEAMHNYNVYLEQQIKDGQAREKELKGLLVCLEDCEHMDEVRHYINVHRKEPTKQALKK